MGVSGEGVNGVWVNGMRENVIGAITYLQYWCFFKRLKIHQNLDKKVFKNRVRNCLYLVHARVGGVAR